MDETGTLLAENIDKIAIKTLKDADQLVLYRIGLLSHCSPFVNSSVPTLLKITM
jgi:hypothetical protein